MRRQNNFREKKNRHFETFPIPLVQKKTPPEPWHSAPRSGVRSGVVSDSAPPARLNVLSATPPDKDFPLGDMGTFLLENSRGSSSR